MRFSCFKSYQLMYFKNKRSGKAKLGQVFWLTFWYSTCLPTPFWDVKDFIGYNIFRYIFCSYCTYNHVYIHLQAIGYSMMTSIYIKFLLFVEKLRRKRCVYYCIKYSIYQASIYVLYAFVLGSEQYPDDSDYTTTVHFLSKCFQLCIHLSLSLSLSLSFPLRSVWEPERSLKID